MQRRLWILAGCYWTIGINAWQGVEDWTSQQEYVHSKRTTKVKNERQSDILKQEWIVIDYEKQEEVEDKLQQQATAETDQTSNVL